ncbi:MAG: LysR substrate-binding domain-containing protein, partial [Methylotenera sp.]|nr:LysR substrate-binding domain-containing protein [Methylotenera sp.]
TDLRAYRHLVVRDSSKKRDQRAAFVEVDQRWTVSQVATSIEAVAMGYGFAWLPEEHIKLELKSGLLRPLPLLEGGVREIPLYLVLANPDFAGPGIRRMTEIIKNSVE